MDRWWWLSPLASVVILLTLAVGLDWAFFPAGNAGGASTPRTLADTCLKPGVEGEGKEIAAVRLREASARAAWGVAYLAQTVTFTACIIFFAMTVVEQFMKSREGQWLRLGLSTLTAAAVVLYFVREVPNAEESGSSFLRTAFLWEPLKSMQLERVGLLVRIGNCLLGLLCVTGVLAVCSALYESHQTRADERESLIGRISTLKQLLNVAALALSVGVIQVCFEYRWASIVPVLGKPDKVWGPAAEAANSIILSCGGLLSLLLAATFLPAAAVLHSRVCSYNGKAGRPPLQRIRVQWRGLAGDALKILGPLLTAGPLASILSK